MARLEPEVVVKLVEMAANMSRGSESSKKPTLDRFRVIYRHLYATVNGADGALLDPNKSWDEKTDEGVGNL